MQSCGSDMQDRKLIFIEPFMKHGYVRSAKRPLIENMESKTIFDNSI